MTPRELRDLLMPAAEQPMLPRRGREQRPHHAVYVYLEEGERVILRRARRKKAAEHTPEERRVYRLWRRLHEKMRRAGLDQDYRRNRAYQAWLRQNGHDPGAPHDPELYKAWLRSTR